jgi:hypothetical protein
MAGWRFIYWQLAVGSWQLQLAIGIWHLADSQPLIANSQSLPLAGKGVRVKVSGTLTKPEGS